MKKLVMLAREITKKEITAGIGTEQSSTRLAPIFKTTGLRVPTLRDGQPITPEIPINPFEGTPLLLMPLLFIPHHESFLFGTPSINDSIRKLNLQPSKIINDNGKGTASPLIATALESKDEEILILAPCDQYLSNKVSSSVESILQKIDDGKFSSGTILTTGTKNPAFSYIKVKGDKAVEFMLKGTVPKDNMIAETMIVCCKVDYLKKQILKMRNASLKELKKIYPYSDDEIKKIQQTLNEICKLIDTCKDASDYLEKCPFCDFSKIIHRLLIDDMTYATVEYQKEWDDLGDWLKVYRSIHFPKDENGNLILSRKDHIIYTNCKNSVIANFTSEKMIVDNIENRIYAAGPRGVINIPIETDPADFKSKVVKLKM